MGIKPPKPNDMLGWLDTVNDSLQKLTDYLDVVFMDIESCPQATVDFLCEKASGYVSYGLEYAKVKIINNLSGQKKVAEDVINDYTVLLSAIDAIGSPTPDNIVGVVGNIIKVIKIIYQYVLKPYQEAIQFITELTSKIIQISTNMQKIANYTPPQAPDINFNKFKIKFKPFTIADLGGELEYPEPPGPVNFPNPFEDTADLIKQAKEARQQKQQNASS